MAKPERKSARARKAKAAVVNRLSAEDGFVGAGLSRTESGDDEIVVMVRDAGSPAATNAPCECEGIPVRTEVVGQPRKHRAE